MQLFGKNNMLTEQNKYMPNFILLLICLNPQAPSPVVWGSRGGRVGQGFLGGRGGAALECSTFFLIYCSAIWLHSFIASFKMFCLLSNELLGCGLPESRLRLLQPKATETTVLEHTLSSSGLVEPHGERSAYKKPVPKQTFVSKIYGTCS